MSVTAARAAVVPAAARRLDGIILLGAALGGCSGRQLRGPAKTMQRAVRGVGIP